MVCLRDSCMKPVIRKPRMQCVSLPMMTSALVSAWSCDNLTHANRLKIPQTSYHVCSPKGQESKKKAQQDCAPLVNYMWRSILLQKTGCCYQLQATGIPWLATPHPPDYWFRHVSSDSSLITSPLKSLMLTLLYVTTWIIQDKPYLKTERARK